ncbi:MAG: glycosyltransferase family 4 protein [Candidatus Helarchaeota archaeon]
MKILFITEKWYPEASGGEIFFNNLASFLAKRGHAINIITGKPVKYLNKSFKLLDSFPADFNQQNFSLSNIFKRILFGFFLLISISRIKKAKIDVIHAIPPVCSIAAYIFGKILKIPVVISLLSYGYEEWYEITKSSIKNTFFQKIQAFAWKLNYQKIYSISKNFIKLAEKLKIDKEKIEIIPNAVNCDLFKPSVNEKLRRKLDLKKDDFVIGFFGSFEKVKRIDKLILAMNLLDKHPNIKLLIVGNGSEENNLRELIKKYELENIRFHERVQHHLMPHFLSIVDVIALPSASEGFPAIVLESLASGKPVITTVVGEIEHVLENRKTGLFLSNNIEAIPAEISNAILELYLNKELYEKLSNEGLKLARSFSWESVCQRFEKSYQEIIY